MGDDQRELGEWIDITTLADAYETQLNSVTGELRYRRQRIPRLIKETNNTFEYDETEEFEWVYGDPPNG